MPTDSSWIFEAALLKIPKMKQLFNHCSLRRIRATRISPYDACVVEGEATSHSNVRTLIFTTNSANRPR